MTYPYVSESVIDAIAPTGRLRAGINLSNFLLVSHLETDGNPVGVSPDMAAALADQLGVGVEFITFPNPGDAADAAIQDIWDTGNIGADPARAQHINFSAAYAEIECTYLVPAGSPITAISEVDRPGVRISVKQRAAYDLWLERNLEHAKLVHSDSLDSAFETFVEQNLDALACLRPRLEADAAKLPGSRILDGRFSAVRQAMGTPRDRDPVGVDYLNAFVAEAKASGLVGELIAKHGADGLSVAASSDL